MSVILRWLKRLEVRKGLVLLAISIPLMLILPKPGSTNQNLLETFINRFMPLPIFSISLNLILLVVLLWLLYIKKPDMNFRKMVRDVLGGNIGTFFGLIALILELVLIGWITDYLREGVLWAAFSSFALFFNNLILFMLMAGSPRQLTRTREPDRKKVLIFALSRPRVLTRSGECTEKFMEISRCLALHYLRIPFSDNDKCKTLINTCDTNWRPPIRYIAYHWDKVEKVLILVSRDGSDEHFDEFVSLFKNQTTNKNIEFIKVGPLDFNDYQEILYNIKLALKKIFRMGYDDEDLSFMISGGTSAVTAALIISAVRDGRQVEYFTQDEKKELISIDVNILDVRRLFGGDID